MTVAELIAELQKMPAGAKCVLRVDCPDEQRMHFEDLDSVADIGDGMVALDAPEDSY